MNQKELCNKIGMADRTFRRLSPRKRQQWQALAAKGRTAQWYSLLAELMFEVEAFNADNRFDWLWMQVSGVSSSVTHFSQGGYHAELEFLNIDQLTTALQYVQSLTK